MCPRGRGTRGGDQTILAGESLSHAIPRRRDDLHVEKLDGEAILYDPRYEAVHRFNAVTLFIWNNCDGLRSTTEIAGLLIGRYAIGRDSGLAHVERTVVELAELGLVEHDSATDGDLVPPEDEHSPTDRPELTGTTGGYRPDCRPFELRGLTRREVLGGGAAKLIFAAPVILTFCATPAYADASNPIHPGSPFGLGGCKNVGYSCAVKQDCCGEGLELTDCIDNVCCVKANKSGCVFDEDCCDFPAKTCDGGQCN